MFFTEKGGILSSRLTQNNTDFFRRSLRIKENKMTTEYSDIKTLKKLLLSRNDYHPYPKYNEREEWAKIHPDIAKRYQGEDFKKRILEYDSTALTATSYMYLFRTGRRDGTWGGIFSSRRDTLLSAVLAECLEHKGEYIDKIIDIAWAICEESSWILPAHNNHMHNHMLSGINKNALPDILDFNFIDLDAGMTAGVLGWTYYFLKDRLDEESPLICKRIEIELYKKIIIPFMTHDDLTWYGFYGHKINNWNPWILSGIIPAGLIVIKDEDYRLEFMSKALEKLDIYINNCAPDGGSDEGPNYWNVGGGTFLDALEAIKDATGSKLDLLKTDFARNVAEYIAHANLMGDLYANFGDNPTQLDFSHYEYRFAKLTGSDYLMDHALSKPGVTRIPDLGKFTIFRNLKFFFEYGPVLEEKKRTFTHKDIWLPQTEHLYVLSSKGNISFSAKCGYNNESHNHNDIGSFIYVVDGESAIADLGGPEYTDKTFSPLRYDYWIVQSTSHNCAMINGYQQHNGDEFRGKVINASLSDSKVSLVLNMKKAYEEEAGIKSYVRDFEFDKATGVLEITDDIQLYEASDNLDLHFLTQKETEGSKSTVLIKLSNGKNVEISVPGTDVSFERHFNISSDEGHRMSDKIVLEDGRHCDASRMVFKATPKTDHHIFRTTIRTL